MVYVHVPFCRSFCIYCDFYSETACRGKDAGMVAEWTDGIVSEIEERADEIRSTLPTCNTLYFGGGTPSVLPLSCLGSVLDALGRTGARGFDEFTFEVNPEDIIEKGVEYVRGLMSLGVGRISMGVQSLDDGILRWMNRRHSSEGARRAMGILREAGVGNVSVDVIFGLSNLSDEVLESTLSEIVAMGPEHVSAYQLSIEEGSALAEKVSRGEYEEASEEACARQYELICRRLSEAGYTHYEISNWARPGFEARHNSAYWERLPYVGLGPAAHSLIVRPDGTQMRSWNPEQPSGWRLADASARTEILGYEDVRLETLMLGLRTSRGLPMETMTGLCGHGHVEQFLSDARLERTPEGRIRIPEKSFFVSESIIVGLI